MINQFRVWNKKHRTYRHFTMKDFPIICQTFQAGGMHEFNQIEQSTGMRDTNKKEVYPFDFFKRNGETRVVTWLKERASYVTLSLKDHKKYTSEKRSDLDFLFVDLIDEEIQTKEIIGSVKDPMMKPFLDAKKEVVSELQNTPV